MEFNATFIIAIVSFIIFMLIMNKILYKPISAVVEMRENLISGNYNAAQSSNEKAEQLYANREERLKQNAAENKQLTTDSLNNANNQAKIKINEAKQNSIAQINSAKSELQGKTEQLNGEIQGRIDEFANSISAKILGDI